jgi:general secretion pathway protein I
MKAPRTCGFTLLEVLVALAIVAISLGAGLRATGVLTDNAQRLPGVGDADFACEQLGRSYPGKLVTRPTLNPSFRRVDAVISDDAGRPLFTLTTVLGRQ